MGPGDFERPAWLGGTEGPAGQEGIAGLEGAMETAGLGLEVNEGFTWLGGAEGPVGQEEKVLPG